MNICHKCKNESKEVRDVDDDWILMYCGECNEHYYIDRKEDNKK